MDKQRNLIFRKNFDLGYWRVLFLLSQTLSLMLYLNILPLCTYSIRLKTESVWLVVVTWSLVFPLLFPSASCAPHLGWFVIGHLGQMLGGGAKGFLAVGPVTVLNLRPGRRKKSVFSLLQLSLSVKGWKMEAHDNLNRKMAERKGKPRRPEKLR